ncbi:MAG: CocE/NonD family hydrolase [Ferruginibacter sp.]
MQKFLLFTALLVFTLSASSQNTDSAWFVNNYTKKEVMIPMRDGIKLFTSIYLPKDKTEKHPILMTRTPYSCWPYGEDKMLYIWEGYEMAYAKENYIIVTQDVRGRYMSEGEFMDVRPFLPIKKRPKDIDESTDTYDAIDWMIKNLENNNGNVGVFGISYPGFYSTMAAASGHPALKAVSPQAPVTDWFVGDDFHHNGAFFQMDAFSFYSSFGKPRPKPTMDYGPGYKFGIKDNYKFYLQAGSLKNLGRMIGDSIKFWHEMMQHPDYDRWWKERNARNALINIKPAMLWVGGLFDAEDLWGALNTYKATATQSPKTNNKLVMGPWSHGQWASKDASRLGNIRFGNNTADWFQQNIEVPFFNYHLKGKGSADGIAKANIFFTGENNWKKFDQWPPANIENRELYIGFDGKLTFNKDPRPQRLTGRGSNSMGYSEYVSDPAHPVPYTEDVHERRTREYMTDDQRFASRRPDVLSFTTDVLTEDISLAGSVLAELQTSISSTDADFVVKLIDVFPDDFKYEETTTGNNVTPARSLYPMNGYEMLVRGEIMRGKFRNSFETPQPFTPNLITPLKFALPDVAHTFKKGHRIMIQVQSSWFPLADRNPQQFMNIYQAEEKDFQKATIRIYHNNSAKTKFILPVVK